MAFALALFSALGRGAPGNAVTLLIGIALTNLL